MSRVCKAFYFSCQRQPDNCFRDALFRRLLTAHQKLFHKKTSRQYLKSFVLPRNVNNIFVSYFFRFEFSSRKKIIFYPNFEELEEKLDYAPLNIWAVFLLFVSKKVEHFLCQDFCNMFNFSASVREQIHQNNREGGLINVNPIIVFVMVCSRLPTAYLKLFNKTTQR